NFDLFGVDFCLLQSQTCDVTAGPRETGYKFIRIIDRRHYNRNHRGGFLRRPRRRATVGNEHVDLLANELTRESTQIRIVLGRARLDLYRTSVDIVEVVKARPERVKQRIWANGGRQPPQVKDFVRLGAEAFLRAQDKRRDARD